MNLERNDNYRGVTYGSLKVGQLFTLGNNVETVFMKSDEHESDGGMLPETWAMCLSSDQYEVGILKTFADSDKVTVVQYKMVEL